MDAMEFFRQSAGRWRSQRATHHLAFRRGETGNSEIYVETLVADHPKIREICQLHQVDPSLAVGGAFVSWDGTMDWDKEEENHEGTTVFALIPDEDDPRQGKMLRDRGYAETIPAIGRYRMDEENALILETEYETMTSTERFWFVGSNIRMRTSAVSWFGGLNKTTFCIEVRVEETPEDRTQKISDTQTNLASAISGW